MSSPLPVKLEALVEEFADADPRERLEMLLDFAEHLPPLTEHLQAERAAGCNRVNECQTAVYLWVETVEGRVQLYADVAPEAPTVKGFVALLVNALSGETPAAVASIDPSLLERFGLVEVLGMVRMRGLTGIINRIRREAGEIASA